MKPYPLHAHSGMIVLDGLDLRELDLEIADLERDFKVREIDIAFKEERLQFSQIRSSQDAYNFIRDVIFDGLEIQEHFVVLYMNQSNRIIGYYKHSKGTINSTQVDIQLVTAVAIKTLAKGMILSHNHPSGNTTPSEADRRMTKKLKEAAGMFDISVLDHIIATADSYYSFADRGDASLSGPSDSDKDLINQLRSRVMHALKAVTSANSPNVFAQIQSERGYQRMEEMVLERVIRDNRIPEAIIPQIEMQWQ
jgi:DNA repair protein RadC